MQKLLFAVQAKSLEDMLRERLAPNGVLATGAVAYREAIIPSLTESPADILLFRESLKGSVETFDLMRQIRIAAPKVRIVFLANEQSTYSRLFGQLVCLGIYDIINSNSPTIDMLEDYITSPRDFGYANKFFRPETMADLLPAVAEAPQVQPSKKPGLLNNLIEKITPPTHSTPTPTTTSHSPANTVPKQPIPEPSIPAPTADFETMRSAMLEEARRTAQAEIPRLVQMQVDMETASMKAEMEKQTSMHSEIVQDLQNKSAMVIDLTNQLENMTALKKSAEEQMRKIRSEAELASQNYQVQLTNLQTVRPPEWYETQMSKWQAERDSLQAKIAGLEQTIRGLTEQVQAAVLEKSRLESKIEEQAKEVESLKLAVPRDISQAVDEALDDEFVIIPDGEQNYRASADNGSKILAFMGTKHGVGNSTVALNTAIAFANCGFKTLYIEVNRQFPMANTFFDFTNIVRGLDTAIKAVVQGNRSLASQCIIRPHGIQTQNRSAAKIYKRLPGPLHFLLYSNDYLQKCKLGENPAMEEQDWKDLAYFITMQEHYSFVILDLQPDDREAFEVFLNSSFPVNKLVMTATQDPHSLTTAGYIIPTLARGRNPGLIKNAEFVINQFSAENKMPLNKIADFLRVPTSHLSKLSFDRKGYMNACYSGVPYMLNSGSNTKEYIDLRMKLS